MASEIRRRDSRGGSKPQRVKARMPSSVRCDEVVAEGVGGVEVVFGEREGAGGGGGPGVHQGGLQHLVFVGAAADEAAAVFDEDVHVGAQVEAVAELGEALAHDGVGDDRVDLDAGDVVAAG